LEQYCQLILKYKLLVKVGAYPRIIHWLSCLGCCPRWSLGSAPLLEDECSFMILTKLEDAYIVRAVAKYVRGCPALQSRGFELYLELAEERRRLAGRLWEELNVLVRRKFLEYPLEIHVVSEEQFER